MSFLDRIKSLFSGGSAGDDDRVHQLQSPTHPEPTGRQPTEAEIQAAAAATPPTTPVAPASEAQPTVEPGGVPGYEGMDGRQEPDESMPVDEREDPAP